MPTDLQTLAQTTLSLLRAIAPEVSAETLHRDQPLRHQVDLDSMDWLNFLLSLHKHFGVTIAESDYARLITFNNIVDYLHAKLT